VFEEIDHGAAAHAASVDSPTGTLALFGNPKAGTNAMRVQPTLALDQPMRVLGWDDKQGRVVVMHSTGRNIALWFFARHGIVVPPAREIDTDRFIDTVIRMAAE